ncbi:uncharacterized protein MEPE_00269 [Melanopsichium pennsylvanicum]|uniref:AB hydrolase-1 domain-containing protein n=2 Tax=Melanopsichium pennsylvanicum TaxID=63383 RepID=A0AAJ4XFK6_9BASI|nr:conserved hypothetical protein [Melanopsichium pennsylvanicum 4]SNX81564.1 uncharacterized protein MEPE_00269 [Melanopsichium pennsylvanicum]
MERRTYSQTTSSSIAQASPDAASSQRHWPSKAERPSSQTSGPSGKSYYDLYPERKRTGPYIPKPALVAHEYASCHSSASISRDGTVRRSRSWSRLDSCYRGTPSPADRKDSAAPLRPPEEIQADQRLSRPVQRSASSTYAASSIALGRAPPHAFAPEAVMSIEEIVRTHSNSLLTVPPSQRNLQRSMSWTAFEHTVPRPQSPATSHRAHYEAIMDIESDCSEGSIEQEARTLPQSAPVGHLKRSMAQLSLGNIDPRTGSVRHEARRNVEVRIASPTRSSIRQNLVRESDASGPASTRRGLTRCVQVNVPGAPHLQVSFADVGLERGHPVMVFLGLGASRHLIGFYEGLATSLSLRLICIDRWGIGRTDSVAPEGRNILSWSFIVEQVADLLTIDKFSVLAHSAGAPFAAALALLFPHRVQGPLHLLSPWTGMQQDSGYRWLRYIPDGVIKTAQAAEWKLQNWKLGKEAPKFTNKTTVIASNGDAHDSRRQVHGDTHRRLTPPPKQRAQHSVDPALKQAPLLIGDASGGSSGTSDTYRGLARRVAEDGNRPILVQEDDDLMLADSERNSALDLLRASHSESARGLVDDLNLVLGKRPWGFGYADLQIACEVWHGSKDERIPLSSSISLSKEMKGCVLHIVDGASHSLMTNSDVVIQVFESICKHNST